MQYDQRTRVALDAIRPNMERFHSALAVTTEEVRGLLSGAGESAEDHTIALGNFASGHVDIDRFSSFTRKTGNLDPDAEAPIRAAQKTLKDLLEIGDRLFVVELPEGANLATEVDRQLKQIGCAFSAAHVVELAKRGKFREEEHAVLLDGLAFSEWSKSERALAPGLVIVLNGADFTPAQVAPYLDVGMKMVFVVNGDAPAAALSRLVTPGVFVQQATGESALESFAAFAGMAVAALVPDGAVQFVHDPLAGENTYERFTSLELPREIRKRAIGGISAGQQAEDYELLKTLAVVPAVSGEAASDPAGKLSAWLLSQTDLVGEG